MRSLVCLAVAASVMSAGTATAKPRIRDMDMMEVFEPPRPCGSGKTWAAVKKCLTKNFTITERHHTATHKVLELVPSHTSTPGQPATLVVYSEIGGQWQQATYTTRLSASATLLAVTDYATPNGTAVRIDIGTSARHFIAVNEGAPARRGLLRRTTTAVCLPGGVSCPTLTTSCEAYVRGRVYWHFAGVLVWMPTVGLRMRGSTRAAGKLCKPPSSWMLAEDEAS